MQGPGAPSVPGLALGQMVFVAGHDVPPTTRRSDARNLATVRGVELDLDGAALRRSGAGTARAKARARFDDAGDSGSGGGPAGAAGQEDARGADAISDSSSSGGHGRAPPSKHRPHTEEEREAEMAAKGSRKARAWLESGFHHVGQTVSAGN